MAKKRIAIESTLGNFRDYLTEKGYEIVQLDPHTQTGIELKNCDAIIVSGQDEDLIGMNTAKTEAPVIDTRGMTPEQVLNRIEQTFKSL